MKKYLKIALCSLIASCFSISGYSEGSVEQLSSDLRTLLKQEMMAIEQGVKDIIPAYLSGDFSNVALISKQIKNSYILKQKLTKKQMHELHHTLSRDFISKDKEFHNYAELLEHASHKENTELVGFYFSKLLESCVGCHTEHAGHRFPKLVEQNDKNEHHH